MCTVCVCGVIILRMDIGGKLYCAILTSEDLDPIECLRGS